MDKYYSNSGNDMAAAIQVEPGVQSLVCVDPLTADECITFQQTVNSWQV